MKKLLLTFALVLAAIYVNAQTDSTLQQYTGKYKFPDGSPTSEIDMVLDNGMLMGNSSIGSSEFKKREGDIFDIVAYAGTATFRRNSEGKITGVYIEVGDTRMEGTKSDEKIHGLTALRFHSYR
jgi:hypothetical protein